MSKFFSVAGDKLSVEGAVAVMEIDGSSWTLGLNGKGSAQETSVAGCGC